MGLRFNINEQTPAMFIIGVILLIVALWACGPLVLIWSLNVLVPSLAIPYTLQTWFAGLLVMGLLRGGSSGGNSSS